MRLPPPMETSARLCARNPHDLHFGYWTSGGCLSAPGDEDAFTPGARKLIRSLPYPLFTCDAVLTEAAHFLRSPAKLLEAVTRGLLVSRFDTQNAASRLSELVKKY